MPVPAEMTAPAETPAPAEMPAPAQTMAAGGPPPGLDGPDIELLRLVAAGLPLDVVGRRLQLSDRTVRRRLKAIRERLGVDSSIQVIAWAARRGLV
jgi:DNA-binding NarL/FixJ family response regulator